MADSVAAQFRPAPGMSLGDMVNMANAVQQYQQAQQLNPVQLEAAQTNLSRLQQLIGPEVREKTALASKAEGTLQPSIDLATQQAENARIEGLKAQYGLDSQQHSDFAKLLGGYQYDKRLDPENLKVNPNDAVEVMHEIQAEAKARNIPDKKIAVITAPGMAKAMQKPLEFPDYLKNMTMTGMSAAEQRAAGLEKTEVTPEGRVARTTPAIYGKQQQVNVEPLGGLQTPSNTNLPIAGTEIAPNVKLAYPVRSANQPYIKEPSEESDRSSGITYRNNLTDAQSQLTTNRRNTEEVMKQANKVGQQLYFQKGGIPGTVEQKIRSAIGSDQYDLLAKDLANMSISNAKAMGNLGSTVAGLDMQQVALGTVKVPPDVLISIARRVQADQKNVDMQAQASQKFSQKFGDQNLHATFRPEWNKNAESEIFEGMNIINSVRDPKARDKALNELFPTPEDRTLFLKKYQNLKSMAATGVPIHALPNEGR
jgi:hypothetical protein